MSNWSSRTSDDNPGYKPYLFLGTFAAAGLALAIWAFMLWAEALSTLTWPSVTGEVIATEVVKREITQRQSSAKSIVFAAKIEYRYEVDGIPYRNNKPRLGGWGGHRFEERAERDLKPYHVGDEVTVYYRRDDPQQSYLETGSFGPAVLATVFAFGCLFLPVFAVVVSRATNTPL